MRFMLMTSLNRSGEPCAPPDPRLLSAIEGLSDEMTRAGVLIGTGGMGANVTRLRLAGGEVRITDGPFSEAKEVIGGYAIIEVASLEEAIAMTRRFLSLHREILGPDYETDNEIRRLYGPWDHESPPSGAAATAAG